MGLTSALNTSLNGLGLNETSIDVLSNNIANAGTNGFKSSRVLFSTQLARTLSVGSAATANNGGTNPRQVGLGAINSAIQVDFSQGSVTNSSSPSDLAIQGDGFFIVEGAEGNVFTRNGNFGLNENSNLSNSQGLVLQGYGIDEDFELVTTTLESIRIPLGDLQVAAATRNISIGGALLPSGTVASQGTTLLSLELWDDTAGAGISDATLLTDTSLASDPGSPLFTLGETISVTPQKGSRNISPQTFDIAATTTIADFRNFLDEALGLQTTGTTSNPMPVDADSVAVGTSVQTGTVGNTIRIKGNRGTVNDIDIPIGSITGDNGVIPFGFSGISRSDGESTTTTFVVYDSLGQEVTMKMSAVLESQDSTSTTFRYYLESPDDSDVDIAVGNSILTFDNIGDVSSSPDNIFSIDRTDSAAVSPLQITVDLSTVSGISTDTAGSTLNLISQDGSDPGTLTSFVIDEQGIINGIFNNGVIRTLGQIVLARFANPQGLLQSGNDSYREGVASGLPLLATPGSFGAGQIRAGAIELSNTDIGRNLVDLIVASTNYRGNARVISSVQQLVDELLILGR